jgi:3'5'-cyclic nucleotide phosphodiesterase
MRRNSVDSGLSSRRGSSSSYADSRGSANSSMAFNGIASLSDKHQLLLLESVLHIADVSNPAKPWNLYSRWLDGVMTEFYSQGKRYKEGCTTLTQLSFDNSPFYVMLYTVFIFKQLPADSR